MTAKTFAGTSADADELWVNDVYGDSAPWRVSVPLGVEGGNKVVQIVLATRDWIIYTANNGSSTANPSTDPRIIYLTSWGNGASNYALSPSSTVATAASPALGSCFSIWNSRCATLFSPDFAWIAVREFVESQTQPSVRVFSVSSRALVSSGNAINPPLAPFDPVLPNGVVEMWWSWDSLYLFFTCRPQATPNQLHLYLFKPSEAGAQALRISPDVNDFGGIDGPVLITRAGFVVFSVLQVRDGNAPALFAYDFRGASGTLRRLNPPLVAGAAAISAVKVLPALDSSSPYVTFLAQTESQFTNLWSFSLTASNAVAVKLNPAMQGAGPTAATPVKYVADPVDRNARSYVVFQAAAPSTAINLYCAQVGSETAAVRISPDLSNVLVNPNQISYVYRPPLGDSNDPLIFFAGIVAGQTTPFYYVARCMSGASTQLSRNTAQPSVGGLLGALKISPDRRWVAFTSQTALPASFASSLFVMPSDGSELPFLANDASGAQTVESNYDFSLNSQTLLSVRTDSSGATSTRLYSTALRLPLGASVDLTPANPDFPVTNPLGNAGAPLTTSSLAQFLAFQDLSVVYAMAYPGTNGSSPEGIYAVSVHGGDTVLVSWNTTSFPRLFAKQGQWLRMTTRRQIVFFGDGDGQGGADMYVNMASASTIWGVWLCGVIVCILGMALL